MTADRWHLITGEYPPSPGGVADYTALLAAALAEGGAEVHVWTSRGAASAAAEDRAAVHRLVADWSRAELARLDEALDGFAPPRRLLVQYTPGAWGYKGLNLGFCRWLVQRRARGDDVRVMFHEVWYPLQLRDRPRRWLLALGQRLMARTLMDACCSAYVSIPAWEPLLRASERPRDGRRPVTVAWLPVPSNIPVNEDAEAVARLRGRLVPGGETLVGSFGTFSGMIGDLLAATLPRVLDGRADRVGLILGRGSDRFASRLLAGHPELAGRLHAAGALPADETSIHLQACDLLVQPYPDGLSSRRGSLMAGLAHGVATVSNLGRLSEPVWERTGCVALAAAPDPAALTAAAAPLLASAEARAALGSAARATYRRHFAVERTAEALAGSTMPASADPQMAGKAHPAKT
jgi:glycosyltransferase involved in cell wall biosynthesis